MCGSLVRYEDRTSTLGLLISVDSKLYGLTVDHLFRNQTNEEEFTFAKNLEISLDEQDTTGDQDGSEIFDKSWIDDVIYGVVDNNEDALDPASATTRASQVDVTMTDVSVEHQAWTITGQKVDSTCEVDGSRPYLDWALIDFHDGYFKRPNAFFSTDDPEHPNFFAKISSTPELNGFQVFMISGVSGIRKGVLGQGNSYIGSKPGQKLCEAWDVILSDSIGGLQILETINSG
jgi:hypothetical protein